MYFSQVPKTRFGYFFKKFLEEVSPSFLPSTYIFESLNTTMWCGQIENSVCILCSRKSGVKFKQGRTQGEG